MFALCRNRVEVRVKPNDNVRVSQRNNSPRLGRAGADGDEPALQGGAPFDHPFAYLHGGFRQFAPRRIGARHQAAGGVLAAPSHGLGALDHGLHGSLQATVPVLFEHGPAALARLYLL